MEGFDDPEEVVAVTATAPIASPAANTPACNASDMFRAVGCSSLHVSESRANPLAILAMSTCGEPLVLEGLKKCFATQMSVTTKFSMSQTRKGLEDSMPQ